MLLLLLHAFPNALPDGLECFEVSQRLGKSIVEFRQDFFLYGFNSDPVGECLAGEALILRVLGIGNLKSALLTRVGAAQVLGELGKGIGAADFDHHVVHLRALAAAFFRSAGKADLREVPLRQGTTLYRVKSGMLLAQPCELSLYFFVAHAYFG